MEDIHSHVQFYQNKKLEPVPESSSKNVEKAQLSGSNLG
jgi:hypothetical protein